MKIYSLKKSKHILRHTFHLFEKKKKSLSTDKQDLLKKALLALQEEVMRKDQKRASELALHIQELSATHLKKSSWDHLKEMTFALSFALIIAIIVRQICFEFYEIPSGSMRPTLKEQDRLVVSKTSFGINVPLSPHAFYFDPSLVQRNGIVIFTGENMDIRDVDTMYFYLFPGKKQYIKRMIGKPGDILYFYGGLIYGIDSEGNDITPDLQLESLSKIDHIPFIDFDRKIQAPSNPTGGIYSPVYIYQMNEPVVKLSVNANHQIHAEMINSIPTHATNAKNVVDYGDLWGFKNYGMARLLTRDQVKILTDHNSALLEEGELYLEIRHHPTLEGVKLIRDEMGRLRPSIGLSTSIIPLRQEHLNAIFQNLYTARFEVKNGVAYRYGLDPKIAATNMFLPKLPDVPDGCYEFYNGIAYRVRWQGITQALPLNHPLYRQTPALTQLLFNVGIEWDTRFSPQIKNQRLIPSRYTYFRNGNLYLLGSPVIMDKDPILTNFLEREHRRQITSNPQAPYQPFEDLGPPFKKDALDKDFIRQNGIQIPSNMYLVLGDNHAMSADSREFGFVPASNLRGSPDLIFWPPGDRFGTLLQQSYPFMNFPRGIVWILAAFSITVYWIRWNKLNRLPLKIESYTKP